MNIVTAPASKKSITPEMLIIILCLCMMKNSSLKSFCDDYTQSPVLIHGFMNREEAVCLNMGRAGLIITDV